MPGLLITALVIAVVIKTFLVQPFWIPSESMLPTIEVNDRVLVNKLGMNFGAPGRGDIVVFRDPAEPEVNETIPEAVVRSVLEAIGVRVRGTDDLIKRVVGLPGETVHIANDQVHINGEPLTEAYLADGSTMPDFAEITIPEDSLFLMGDNRRFSLDSRHFGAIPIDDVVGRAFMVMWPISNIGGL